MNSLEQLNNFSTDLIDYGDEADYSISLLNLGPQTATVIEGQSHTAKLGVEIIEIVSGPPTIFLEFDLTAANGNAQLTWPTLPDGVIATNPEPNVYRLTGVSTLLIWNLVKSPTITLTRDYDQSFVYVGEFNGGQGNVVTWNVDLTVLAQGELSTLTPNGIEFQEDITVAFGSNSIRIIDAEEPSDNFYLTGTFSIANAGTILGPVAPGMSYNQFSTYLEISGARTSLNTFLDNMEFEPYPDFDQSFNIVWQLTNPVSGLVTTTFPQSVTCVGTNEEIVNINLSRSYTQNQWTLLFPTDTPYISEEVPGAVYTVSFQLDADIGVIGFGENLITPANWNELTKTFLYQSKSKDEINTMFETVKFFPYADITSNATVTYRQGRNGATTVVENFTLGGTPFFGTIEGSSAETVNEEAAFDAKPTAIFPNWDSPGFSVFLQAQINGVPDTTTGTWVSYPNWAYAGSNGNYSGIFRNYTQAATLTEFENFKADALSTHILQLNADLAQNFTLVRAVNYGGSYNGTEFLGGDTYYANCAVTVNEQDEYTIYSGPYLEDTPFDTQFEILDGSTTATSYTVTLEQNTPDPATQPGYFIVDNVNVGTSWSITNTRDNINAANVWYAPPVDYTGDLVTLFSQSKVDNGVVVIQADNLPVLNYNGGTNPEIINMIDRSYQGNVVNNIFSTSTPFISDGTDVGQIYTITLNSSLGRFGTDIETAQVNYTYTGNLTSVNNHYENIVFVPNPQTQSTGTFNYTQTRDGLSQINRTLTLTGTAGPAVPIGTTVYGSSTAVTLTDAQLNFRNIEILVVGGGGGGGNASDSGSAAIAGGGGAGGSVYSVNFNRFTNPGLTAGTYQLTVGVGGAAQYPGQASYLTDSNSNVFFFAPGGSPGSKLYPGGTGGNTQQVQYTTPSEPPVGGSYVGGTGIRGANDASLGGGGAGARGNGITPSPSSTKLAGQGGTGKSVPLAIDAFPGGFSYIGGGGGGGARTAGVSPSETFFGGVGQHGGGTGGGGNSNSSTLAQPGISKSGGGGGGAGCGGPSSGSDLVGAAGGSGVIVIKVS